MGQERQIKEMVLSRVTQCGQCGVEYGLPDVNVLGHKEDLWFLMLICGTCHQAVGVAAVVKEEAAALTEHTATVTEPSGRGRPRATHENPVSSDDVEAMREFLRDFDGDFKRIFGGAEQGDA